LFNLVFEINLPKFLILILSWKETK
jgi:hypothetical protein